MRVEQAVLGKSDKCGICCAMNEFEVKLSEMEIGHPESAYRGGFDLPDAADRWKVSMRSKRPAPTGRL
jgi:hypothetical protein